jgi:diguanylate cyclase (GGDEF)-like protein/putative nucleotidyltransferase with HDIG domain
MEATPHRRWTKSLRAALRAAAVRPDEREFAGRLSGWLFLTGAATLALLLVLPGAPTDQWRLAIGIAAVAAWWGFTAVRVIDWAAAPPWLIHVSNILGFGMVALAIAITGGMSSPVIGDLFLIVVFATYYYPPRAAIAYVVGCAAIAAMPLLYQRDVIAHGFLGELAIMLPAFFAVGWAIVAGRQVMLRQRSRAEQLAAEQSALRRVATLVASANDPEATYELVAREIARLLDAGASGILRFESDEHLVVMGSWSDGRGGRYEPGTSVPVRAGSDVEAALRSGAPVRIDQHQPGSPVDRLGYACSVIAPIHVGGVVWGILAVVDEERAGLQSDAEVRLTAFGDLLATAIANTESSVRLAAQAATDPLTGLANHRTFHERMTAEIARAQRHGRELSVAVIDVDHFKHVNDSGGHEQGDHALARLGELLAGLARAEDTLARIGGDEFAWLLPEVSAHEAMLALERGRDAVAATNFGAVPITISVGICDLSAADDPQRLFELADGALYWSKVHGRNTVWIYDPEVVSELSAQERAEHLERSRGLIGLRALARAIDAKDPTTRRHSQRVADLAARLARQVGWPAEQVRLLSEAALVHDVGKIGVPDAVLLKNAPLTAEEMAQIRLHAELSAQIVDDVLKPDQVAWIRAHHERPDGNGYPNALRGEEIPEGAALLSVADAWDVMTLSRPYSTPKPFADALAECSSLVGEQFTRPAVEALVALYRAGELSPAEDHDPRESIEVG